MGALTVPVVVDTWQYECCGDEPVVGATVSWALNWEPEHAGEFPSEFALTAPVEPVDPPGWLPPPEGSRYAVARSGPLTVFVTVPAGAREVLLHGALHEDHHAQVPADFPETAGTIRRVRLVSWARRYEPGVEPWEDWPVVPGTLELTDVERAPPGRPDRELDDGTVRSAVSVVVDLAV